MRKKTRFLMFFYAFLMLFMAVFQAFSQNAFLCIAFCGAFNSI